MIRKLLLLALVAITAWLVMGCATNSDGWESRPSSPPLPAVFMEIAADRVASVCGNYYGLTTHGCAVRQYAANVCLIYHGPDAPLWLLAHEALHCAGMNHPIPNIARR